MALKPATWFALAAGLLVLLAVSAFLLRKETPRQTASPPAVQKPQATPSSSSRTGVGEIEAALDSKRDAATQLGFKIGADGTLTEAPSQRVSLLDRLGQMDPAAAAAYSEKVLASKDSPDEWAVALRNYARVRTNVQDRTFLEQKLLEMLTHQPWIDNPSAGFLEAFDVAVHLRATNLIPTLASLIQKKDNPTVAHAAFLALDRLTIVEPVATLGVLQADARLLSGREVTRANLFARADVREPAQRKILEDYLLNPGLGGAELDKFAGLYPNANFMISHNLLTQSATPSQEDLVRRDTEALRVMREWLADPRFAPSMPKLEVMRRRLEMFLQQASAESFQ